MRSNHTAFSSKKRNISTYCVQTYVNVMVLSSRAPRIEPHHVSDQHKNLDCRIILCMVSKLPEKFHAWLILVVTIRNTRRNIDDSRSLPTEEDARTTHGMYFIRTLLKFCFLVKSIHVLAQKGMYMIIEIIANSLTEGGGVSDGQGAYKIFFKKKRFLQNLENGFLITISELMHLTRDTFFHHIAKD